MHLRKQASGCWSEGHCEQSESSTFCLERWAVEPHFPLLYYYHNGAIIQPARHINQASHKFHKILQLYFSAFYFF